jgi:Holliday junction resolvasome RuvABC DNA-binding subunit
MQPHYKDGFIDGVHYYKEGNSVIFKELFHMQNFDNTVGPHPNNQLIINDNIINDVQEALISLGYKAKDAINTIKSIIDINHKDKLLDLDLNNKNKITEELLKKALKKLSPVYSN